MEKQKKEVIESLYVISKQLSSDDNQARCIIVLSDANASLSMRRDPERQKYIWIPDFAGNEANNYFDRYDFLPVDDNNTDKEINKTKRKNIFEKIGTRPYTLRDIKDSISVDDFIKNKISDGCSAIQNCLGEEPQYKDLLKKNDGFELQQWIR